MIRPYVSSDRDALRQLHEQEYAGTFWADPEDPANQWTIVADEDGICGAMTGRLTVEAFLSLDHTYATPAERLRLLTSLSRAGIGILLSEGIPEIHLFPRDRRFARRLARFPGVHADPRIHMYLNVQEAEGAARWAD